MEKPGLSAIPWPTSTWKKWNKKFFQWDHSQPPVQLRGQLKTTEVAGLTSHIKTLAAISISQGQTSVGNSLPFLDREVHLEGDRRLNTEVHMHRPCLIKHQIYLMFAMMLSAPFATGMAISQPKQKAKEGNIRMSRELREPVAIPGGRLSSPQRNPGGSTPQRTKEPSTMVWSFFTWPGSRRSYAQFFLDATSQFISTPSGRDWFTPRTR